MDILEIAIEAEGGVGKLADALGEKQNVVSNWRARRLPRSWAKVLALKYGKSSCMPVAQATQAQAATECIAPASTHTDPERRVGCQPNPYPDLERRAPLAAALAEQKGG